MSEASWHRSISVACKPPHVPNRFNIQIHQIGLYSNLLCLFLTFFDRIRVSTWNRLSFLKGGVLSSAMRQALAFDPIHPVLAESHLAALDRRLTGVITTVKQCMEAQGPDNTLIEDRMNLPHP